MSLVQIAGHEGSRNRERLQEWIWNTYVADTAGWIRRGLVNVEPLEIFQQLERVTPILQMVSDNLQVQLSDIQPQDLMDAQVNQMLSGQISIRDGRIIANLLRASGYPGSIKLAEEFISTIEPRQIHYRTKLPPVFEEYVEDLSSNGRVRSTTADVRRRLAHFIRWAETEGIDLTGGFFLSVRPTHITRYMQFLRRLASIGELSEQSAALNGHLIVRVFQYFSSRYGVPNMAKGVSPPKPATEFPRWIPSEEQVQAYFESIANYSLSVCRDVCIFGLMYTVGLRPIETANISTTDVRVELNEIRIKQKGGDHAIVTIPDSLAWWLRELLSSTPVGGSIFTEDGKPLTQYKRNPIFRLYARIAGWPTIEGPAVFRHAFCTHLLLAGVDYVDINRLARHKDLRTTTHYLHLQKEHIRRSNQAASNLLLKGVELDAYTAQEK